VQNSKPELDASTLQRQGEEIGLCVRMSCAEQNESVEDFWPQFHDHMELAVCATQNWKRDVASARKLGIFGCQVCMHQQLHVLKSTTT